MKMEKKWLGIFLLGLILFSIVPVFAQYGNFNIRQGSENLINFFVDWAEPIFAAVLGGGNYDGYLLFEKVLIFVMLLGMVRVSLGRADIFKENPIIMWIISFIVPILSVRYMSFEWINTILVEHQVLGIALTGILPFVIYLFFLHGVFDHTIPRKIGWAFFIVIYLFLWAGSDQGVYIEVYFWTMVVALLFLLSDGTIHYLFLKQRWAFSKDIKIAERIAELQREVKDLHSSSIPNKDRYIQMKEKEIRKLQRYMH